MKRITIDRTKLELLLGPMDGPVELYDSLGRFLGQFQPAPVEDPTPQPPGNRTEVRQDPDVRSGLYTLEEALAEAMKRLG